MGLDLNHDWEVRSEELECDVSNAVAIAQKESGWMEIDLPCDVRQALIKFGRISEPLERENWKESKWIECKSWWFRRRFSVDQQLREGDAVELVLESLDVEADVILNGNLLGHQASAFYPFRKNVRELLDSDNYLLVRLTTGIERYSDADLDPFARHVCVWNSYERSDSRRILLRKPQFSFGWDWAPRVATCGIVGNAVLERISGVSIRAVHTIIKAISPKALIEIQIEVDNLDRLATRDATVDAKIEYRGSVVGRIGSETMLRSGRNFVKLELYVSEPKLWWPNGLGDQPLYHVKVSVQTTTECCDWPEFRIGIRTIALREDRLNSNDRIFAFLINGVAAFCKGANWVPPDAVYARVSDEKIEFLVREAKNANFNMLRVWGGGRYEPDVFYRSCDECGIMVWQDFMFSCALYPDEKRWFRKEVRRELEYQVWRLRNHPSLVLWCGNNENHMGLTSWWNDERKLSPAYFGGEWIYNQLAPKVVHELSPEIPYWNGSPYGGVHANSEAIGDRHHWHECWFNIEQKRRTDPTAYDEIKAKFVTEFGCIGSPRLSSVLQYIGREDIASRDQQMFQSHINVFERDRPALDDGIDRHFADPKDLELSSYLDYGGLFQGMMYGYAMEAMRVKDQCWGALFWMYNDCWGEIGWSIIDYYSRRKISYYFVKRALAPVALILRSRSDTVIVYGVNEQDRDVFFEADYGYMSCDGDVIAMKDASVRIPARSRSPVMTFPLEYHDLKRGTICVRPRGEKTGCGCATLYSSPLRDLVRPRAVVRVVGIRNSSERTFVTIQSETYAYGVHLTLPEDRGLSDNFYEMLPGEVRTVEIDGTCDSTVLEAMDVRSF